MVSVKAKRTKVEQRRSRRRFLRKLAEVAKLHRKQCKTCRSAFSHRDLDRVKWWLLHHDCKKEQERARSERRTRQVVNSMLQGALIGVLTNAIGSGMIGTGALVGSGPIELPPSWRLPVGGVPKIPNPAYRGKSMVSAVGKARKKNVPK